MGLFDFLGKKCDCPICGRPNAWEARGKVKCWNKECPNYDAAYRREHAPVDVGSEAFEKVDSGWSGKFDPGEFRVKVMYRTAQGENRYYEGDVRTIRDVRAHISMRIVPTGRRVAFDKSRVKNLEELKSHPASSFHDPKPTAAESKVLRAHSRRGTTSPLFETLRQKYPNYE
ncbi:MAG TPA: hypothetical protein VMV61_13725 [Patescibacteria group bacterium]|nr:hypothetical protein [Patescibacteria group bacterium]